MKLPALCILLSLGWMHLKSQSFDFYGSEIKFPALSVSAHDSLVKTSLVPMVLGDYIRSNIRQLNLDDWAIVLFVNKYVDAQFADAAEADKTRILTSCLFTLGMNAAIGVRNKHRMLPLVSIDKRTKYVNGPYFEQDGYKFLPVEPGKGAFGIRKLLIRSKEGNKDIRLDYTIVPIFTEQRLVKKEVFFFNDHSRLTDSLSYEYSKTYVEYFNDLPRREPNENYYKAPVSNALAGSLFPSLNEKVGVCGSRTDSINFLIKFVQTAIEFREDIEIYGKKDFCSFPEGTLAMGEGDCEDKCELFAFLIAHYFHDLDLLFLYYPHHVRVGLADPTVPVGTKTYHTFNGQKYFIVELQNGATVLGDQIFTKNPDYPSKVVR
jgi:hypothetical protein